MSGVISGNYTSPYADAIGTTGSGNNQQQTANSSTATNTSGDSATLVTLSEEAKAAMNKSAALVADAAANMKALLEEAGRSSPLENGKLAVDLSKFDREQLHAIATNADQMFSTDEVGAAQLELQRRFDSALAGPTAVTRATGDFIQLYEAGLEYLNSMTDAEKETTAWKEQRDAVTAVLAQLKANPDQQPEPVKNDPVFDYLVRVSESDEDSERSFAEITTDARAAIDSLYEDGFATNGRAIDFSDFNSRALAAVALNSGNGFTESEVRSAELEVKSRSNETLSAAYKHAQASEDPLSLSKNIIALYDLMSPEERQAAGWNEDFYNAAVNHYEASQTISQMFSTGSSSGSASSLYNFW